MIANVSLGIVVALGICKRIQVLEIDGYSTAYFSKCEWWLHWFQEREKNLEAQIQMLKQQLESHCSQLQDNQKLLTSLQVSALKLNPPPQTSTPLTPHTGYLQGNHAQNTFTYSQVSVSSCQFWFVQSKCVVVNIFGEGGGEVGLVNLWNDLVLIPLFHKLIYTCMLHLLHVWPQTWNSVT